MVACQGAHLACICRLHFICQDTGEALPLICQLALQRARYLREQAAITVCMHKECSDHPCVCIERSYRITAQT